jgi:hypothetical protein
MRHRSFLFAGAAVLIGATLWFLDGHQPPVRADSTSSTRSGSTAARHESAASAQRKSAHSPRAPLDSDEKTSDDILDFESAKNLAVLVAQMSGAAAAGDPEALRVVAMAYDECLPSAIWPDRAETFALYAKSLPEPARTRALFYNTIESNRCSDLVATHEITIETTKALRDRAAEHGDLRALAAKLADDLPSASTEVATAALRDLVASGDAEAIAALATGMGTEIDTSLHAWRHAGSDADVLAWELVACRLGRACGSAGHLMRRLCLEQGQCRHDSYRDFVRQTLATADEFELVQNKERDILEVLSRKNAVLLFP